MFKYLLATFLLLISITSFGWGRKGHQIVAEIAFKNLDVATQNIVLCFLNGMSIEDAATWMDDMRSNPSYNYMKPYHYINAEQGEKLKRVSNDNIISVIEKSLQELKGSSLTNEEIKVRLCYLFHLVGDLHQPLHDGYEIDKGGNTIDLEFNGRKCNLHWLWDDGIIEYKKIDLAMSLSYKQSNEELNALTKIDALKWGQETRTFLPQVYAYNATNLDEQYLGKSTAIILNQLNIAGLRLASILKEYFSERKCIAPIKQHINSIEKTVAINDAAKYDGQTVTICSKVFGTKYLSNSGRQPTFLNLGANYPNSPLTVVIWGDDRDKFTGAPETIFADKNICVNGLVQMFKDKYEIVVSNPSQIEMK